MTMVQNVTRAMKTTKAIYGCPATIYCAGSLIHKTVDVKFTSNEVGETLSVDIDGVTVGIDYEDIARLVRETRREASNEDNQRDD